MNSTAKGTAWAMFFGVIAMVTTRAFVGHIGWQTAVATGVGMIFGRAIAGDLDSKPSNNLTASSAINITENLNNSISSPLSEAEQLNDFAVQLSLTGNMKLAMEHWTKSALAGVPNALASYSWYALRAGNFKDAITLHEESIGKVSNSKDKYQIANCKGNYALNLFALTNDAMPSIKILEDCLQEREYGAIFFLVVLEHLHGSPERAMEIFRIIPNSEYESIKNTLIDESLNASGWFREFCSQSRELFEVFLTAK